MFWSIDHVNNQPRIIHSHLVLKLLLNLLLIIKETTKQSIMHEKERVINHKNSHMKVQSSQPSAQLRSNPGRRGNTKACNEKSAKVGRLIAKEIGIAPLLLERRKGVNNLGKWHKRGSCVDWV